MFVATKPFITKTILKVDKNGQSNAPGYVNYMFAELRTKFHALGARLQQQSNQTVDGISILQVNYPAMLPAMAAAILGRSCDQEGTEGTSHDPVTKEQLYPKRGRRVKGQTIGTNT